MKNKFLSTLLILLIGLGYSVESSAQDFYLKTHNDEYISCGVDGVLVKGKDASNKQVWTVSKEGELTYISTEVGGKTLYLTLNKDQIVSSGSGSNIKVTSKFIAAEDKTNIYLFDGSISGSAAGIVTSVADGNKRYLVSPKITTGSTTTTGYYIFRHDYNTNTPVDAKLMSTTKASDSYYLIEKSSSSPSTITISTSSSANLNTQVIFEKAEAPSVKYGKVTLGDYTATFGTASIAGVTLGTAFSSEAAVAGAASKELTLTAGAKEGYVFKGWQLNGALIEGSATSPFNYTYSYSSESNDPTADVFTPVFKEKGKLTECYITYAGNSSTYYISMKSVTALQRATDKQVWKFGDADDNGMISLSTEYSGSDYFLASSSSNFVPTTDETSLYFFEASNGKLVSELTLGKSYYIVAKSSGKYYVMRYSSSSLTAQSASTSSSSSNYYRLSDTNFNSSTTLTISSSSKSSCTFTLASASTKTYYGKVEVIGVNSTVVVSTSGSTPSTGYVGESSDTWSTETSGEAKDYYFYSKPSDDSEFVCYATDAEGKNPITSTSSQAAASTNNYKCKYAVTPAASENEGNPTTTTIYAVYKKNGSSEQPTTGDGLYLKNMGNSKYLQMVKKATDTASSSTNDGQLGFVESIGESTTSWAFTQYNSSLVKFADSDDNNFVYFGNKGDTGSTYAYKLTGMDKYNKSGNPEAKADNQSSAGAGSKYNCYLYKITDYSESGTSFTATLTTTAEAGGYYFIASADLKSGTGLMLMGNSLSSGTQITIDGKQISSTPGSSSITVNVSNIQNYVYQFVSGGTTPQPTTTTYYGKLIVSATNGTASIAETSGAASSSTTMTVSAKVAADAENGSKVLYLSATPATDYEFLGWSETDGGSIIEGSNVAEYAYTFTFSGTSQSEATSKTLYAVFQQNGSSEQPTTGDGTYYIKNVNTGTYFTSTSSKSSLSSTKQAFTFKSLDNEGLYQVSFSTGGTTYAIDYEKRVFTPITPTTNAADNLYFYEIADINASTLTATQVQTVSTGKYYFILGTSKSSGNTYILSNEPYNSGSLGAVQTTDGSHPSSISLSQSDGASCIYTLESDGSTPQPTATYYGMVTAAIASSSTDGGTVAATSSYNTPSDGKYTAGPSSAVRNAASGSKMHLYLFAKAADGYEFKGWSTNADGSGNLLTSTNNYYQVEFDATSTNEVSPTDGGTYYAVFEKEPEPELSGTKCFLMNGDNYIGYASGKFTLSTTDKQEWAFGTTTPDFITPFSTLVNNQINYLGYPTSVSGSTKVFADVNSSDNNSLYFFDTETNKPASSLEVGKSYYIVSKSTRSESDSRYVVSCDDGTLKTTKANNDDNYKLSNTTITSDVTITLDSSVKAACTFTLASAEPAASSVKYGKVKLAAAVSNGTYSIESGATSGELITSEACTGAATRNIVLSATANDGYVFKGWSVDGGATILSGSNAASYTYTFSFSSEVESTPTEVTLTPVFEEIPVLSGTDFYLKTHNAEYISCNSDGVLSKGSNKQVWTVSEQGGLTYISTTVGEKTLYLKLDESQIVSSGSGSNIKITSKFIAVEDMTNIYLFDGSKSGTAAGIVTSVSDGGKCYLVSPKVDATNNDFDGYYIFRHDYNTTTPVDAKLMVTGSTNDSYNLSVGDPFSNSTITISTSSNAHLNTQVIFEKAETPSVKTYYGTLTVVGTNGTVFASTDKEATSGEAAVNVSKTVPAANATETIYLNAAPNDKYAFLGWSETEDGEIINGSNVEGFAYTFTFNGTEGEPTAKTLYAVFEYKYTTYYGTFNISAGEGGTAFFAAETGATEGSVTEDVNEEVLKTVTSASKTYYLNATTPSDKYDFLGWAETEGGKILEGSNVKDFAYTFTFKGTEDEPTEKTLYAVFEYKYTTYYGTFNVSAGEGGKAFFAAEASATEGKVTEDVNEEVLKTVASASKTYYLNAAPSDKYDFLGWAETEGGEILKDSNVKDFEYTFTFDGTEDEPTVKTLYAVFENKYTTYCGTFNVSAGEGGTAFIAEASGATEGSVTEAVTKVVDKTETSASKTFYLNATAKSGYTFKGWSETEGGEIFVGTNDKDFEYTFTFDGTEDKRTVKTLYAVFEDTKPGDVIPSTDITAYDNILYFNDESTSINRDFNLVLNLKNAEENVTAFQCDVLLPRGIDWEMTTDKNGNEVLKAPAFNTERTDETYHNVTCKRIDGRTIRIIVISTNKDIILGTEGAILTLPLSVADDMEGGDYNIFINNIVIATDQQEQTTIDQTVSKVSVADFNLGDVNSDGQINVTDIVAIVAYMLNESPTPFVFKAADVHADNEINVTDIVGLIDIINTPKAKAANAANGMRSGSYQDSDYALDIVCNGQNVTLNMDNRDNITAFQCDVELSEGVEWVSANGGYAMPEFNKEAGRTDRDRHNISVKRLEDGKFRVIVYSLNNDEFFGSEGAVLNLPLVFTKDASCTISNIVLSKKNADSEYLNGSTYSFDATSIDYIKNAQDANDVIFNVNGVRNNKLMKGVNIINGVKVMVNE